MPRTVLITGVSRGLGASLECKFLENGDRVIGLSSTQRNKALKNRKTFKVDICDEQALRSVFASIRRENWIPDIVINNSAISHNTTALLTTKEQFSNCLNLNLVGSFLVTRESVKLMQKNGRGRVIFLSSINTVLNSVGSIAYSASKKSLETLMATFSKETPYVDVTFNTLALSIVKGTPMADKLDEEALKQKQNSMVKPAFLTVEEVMHGIEFFSSDSASNITNQILYFGGLEHT